MEKKKPEWTLIYESKSSLLDKLYEVYAKDKYKARILYFNDKSNYYKIRVVKFSHENGDFEICVFNEKTGISITNKMYRREKKIESIIYKGGKFWYSTRTKKLTQLTYSGLRSFVGNFAGWNEIDGHAVLKAFFKKFSWVRFISEEPALHNMAFNTIVRYKLYNQTDALKHKFKVPTPVIKVLKNHFKDYQTTDMFKIWKEMKQVLLNIENLKPELISHHMFIDTCKMARTLDKKVNCSWSTKRLEQMHNDWSKEITNTVLEFEEHRELNVGKIYRKFAEVTGYKLLTSNRDLLYEGMTQKHCVATYINKVDRGSAGIFHIDGYTLELNYQTVYTYDVGINWGEFNGTNTENKYLYNTQFRGKYNCNAPAELQIEVSEKILAFNIALANARDCKGDLEKLTKNKTIVKVYDFNLNNFNEYEINVNESKVLDLDDLVDEELPF